MKNNIKYFVTGLFSVLTLCFYSCKEDDEITSEFSLDKEEIAVGENGRQVMPKVCLWRMQTRRLSLKTQQNTESVIMISR